MLNGELYNFRELRAELAARGHEVPGTGDTPVLPHLYEEHGPAFAERLEGMFAVAVWDSDRERLVLARDRLGKKPLLWTQLGDGTLAFASELKALLALPGLPPRRSTWARSTPISRSSTSPATGRPSHGVREAPTRARARRGRAAAIEVDALLGAACRPRDAGRRGVARAGARGRRRRGPASGSIADVPLGALLSGGIDSSVVVGADGPGVDASPVRTFTVGFADERYDERPYARAVAQRYGTRHEEVVLEPDVAETLPRLAEAFDEPLGDEAALPQFLVCEAARRHVTVALTGDGGDESFAGYERYAAVGIAGRAAHVPGAAPARRPPVRCARSLRPGASRARPRSAPRASSRRRRARRASATSG